MPYFRENIFINKKFTLLSTAHVSLDLSGCHVSVMNINTSALTNTDLHVILLSDLIKINLKKKKTKTKIMRPRRR